MSATTRAFLVLADGTVYRGMGFGRLRQPAQATVAEVVFNTSMYGYQEILSDPSYAGQMLCFTYPHIGNVGCNAEDVESGQFYAEAVLMRELSPVASNFRSQQTLPGYLDAHNRMGLSGIDTRALVRHLRDHGAQMGAIAADDGRGEAKIVSLLREQAIAAGSMEGKDYVRAVSCKKAYTWRGMPWRLGTGYSEIGQETALSRPHLVVVDCGVKHNILRLLIDVGFRITVVPSTSTVSDIEALRPDALFLSNGPGDPATLDYVVEPAKHFLGKIPLFGICLGHQILGRALGGKTYKLKFGHRGGNHPVMDKTTGKVEITVQNHGFAVDADSLPRESKAAVSHINLNDRTVEGLEVPSARAFSVQYHPEASPGPHDARYLFKRFFHSVVNP